MKIKFPLPRSGLTHALVIGLVGILALWLKLTHAPFGEWTVVDWFVLWAWSGVVYACFTLALPAVASFYVGGENLGFKIELRPGQILELGPFRGLHEKSLLLDFAGLCPHKYIYERHWCGMYLDPAHPCQIFYRVQLFGIDDEYGEERLLEKEFAEGPHLSRIGNEEALIHPSWEPFIHSAYPRYKLQIEILDIQSDFPFARCTPALEIRDGIPLIPIEVCGGVRVGLGLKTLRRAHEVSLRNATARVIEEYMCCKYLQQLLRVATKSLPKISTQNLSVQTKSDRVCERFDL